MLLAGVCSDSVEERTVSFYWDICFLSLQAILGCGVIALQEGARLFEVVYKCVGLSIAIILDWWRCDVGMRKVGTAIEFREYVAVTVCHTVSSAEAAVTNKE